MNDQNIDFDFVSFSITMIKIIDSIRAHEKKGSKDPIESRINAFYRGIGLPAVRLTSNDIQNIDNWNNGNTFKQNDILLNSNAEATLKSRAFGNKILTSPDVEQIKNVLNINDATVLDSVNNTSGRVQLFPMVVNADMEIFPTEKRIAGAFMSNSEIVHDKIKYHRPLIEMIISTRLNSLGVSDTTKYDKLIAAVYKEFGQTGDDIVKQIEKSFGNISKKLSDIKKIADRVKQNTNIIVIPNKNGIPEQNPDIELDPNIQANLDRIKTNQTDYLNYKKSRLFLFGFDDTFGNNTKTIVGRNLKEAVFASELFSVISDDSGAIESSGNDVDAKIEKMKQDAKIIFRDLDLILGTFSGLSGTDIIAIIYSLFTIDPTILISLLNDDSLNRLKEQVGVDFTQKRVSVKQAIDELQTKVTSTIKEKISDRIKK